MANTVPASVPLPDAGHLLAGNGIASATIDPLFRASNWAEAYQGSGTPRIVNSWPLRGTSTAIWTFTPAASANLVCRWRIPDTRGATSVNCYVYGSSVGGTGEFEFRSTVGGGVTGVQALPTPAALVGPFALTIDASGGFEEVKLYCGPNGGALTVQAVMVTVPPASSPLGTGVGVDGCTAFDASEFGVDLPLGVDQGRQLRTNLVALRAVPHVYWQWSGLADGSLGALGKFMRACPHLMPCPVWLDTDNESWNISVHAYATSDAGSDTYVRIHAMELNGDPIRTLELTVPAAAADAWYTGTIRLPLGSRVLRRLARGVDTILLGVLPIPTAAGAMARYSRITGIEERHMTTAGVRALSAWGV